MVRDVITKKSIIIEIVRIAVTSRITRIIITRIIVMAKKTFVVMETNIRFLLLFIVIFHKKSTFYLYVIEATNNANLNYLLINILCVPTFLICFYNIYENIHCENMLKVLRQSNESERLTD